VAKEKLIFLGQIYFLVVISVNETSSFKSAKHLHLNQQRKNNLYGLFSYHHLSQWSQYKCYLVFFTVFWFLWKRDMFFFLKKSYQGVFYHIFNGYLFFKIMKSHITLCYIMLNVIKWCHNVDNVVQHDFSNLKFGLTWFKQTQKRKIPWPLNTCDRYIAAIFNLISLSKTPW
jgi:hypothetical protein